MKRRTNELGALAGFEKSGHFFFNKPFGRGYDDGLISAIAVCEMLDRAPGKSMADLKNALPKTWSSPTMSPHCADETKYGVVDAVVKHFEAMKNKGEKVAGQPIRDLVTVNGVRVTVEDGSWGLVRASSNKPELVVVVESPVSERACATCSALRRIGPERAVGIVGQLLQHLLDVLGGADQAHLVEIDGDHAAGIVRRPQRQKVREVEELTALDVVGIEREASRIARIVAVAHAQNDDHLFLAAEAYPAAEARVGPGIGLQQRDIELVAAADRHVAGVLSPALAGMWAGQRVFLGYVGRRATAGIMVDVRLAVVADALIDALAGRDRQRRRHAQSQRQPARKTANATRRGSLDPH
jgi:hypothetical protein